MVKVLFLLAALAIILIAFCQTYLAFRSGSFRARGKRLIARNAHPIMFWMNVAGVLLFGFIGVGVLALLMKEMAP